MIAQLFADKTSRIPASFASNTPSSSPYYESDTKLEYLNIDAGNATFNIQGNFASYQGTGPFQGSSLTTVTTTDPDTTVINTTVTGATAPRRWPT